MLYSSSGWIDIKYIEGVVTNYGEGKWGGGGLQNGRGGASDVLPLRKKGGGGRKRF